MPDAVMVTSSFLPGLGGIETYLGALCEQLAPRLAVLAPGRRDRRDLPQDLGYPAMAGPGRMLLPGPRIVRSIVSAAEDHGTDRVLFGTPWPLGLLGPSLSRRGLSYAVIVHGAEMLVPSFVPGVRSLMRRALERADLLLPVSEYTAEKLVRFLGPTAPSVEVLRPPVDLQRFRPHVGGETLRANLGLSPDDKLVLTLGRLVRRKGVHRLIDALPAIRRRVPGAVLVVAGSGPEGPSLRRRAARRGARMVYAGRVPDDQVPLYYAAADVFALAVVDRWFGLEVEGLGVVLLEAAACGVPCVTGRSGGTPEAVIDGVTGRVVDARDPSALANAIAELLESPETAAAMGVAGREHVEREFSGRLPEAFLEWLNRR
jgi:phosphatidylinositol alpha-1,6-mannosyltransferase